MTKSATPFRRTPDVIAKLESDRARLIEFIAKIEDELKVLGKLRAVDLLFSKARALLRQLEGPK